MQVYLWQCIILLVGYATYVTVTVVMSREQERVHLDPLYHEVGIDSFKQPFCIQP